ncbi:MAG: hypothetical protein H7836_01165 [Magnetococcus sp. YQC-3]
MTGVPEMDLWASVLQQALNDLANPQYRHEVELWMASNTFEPGSFLFICEALEIDPDQILAFAWQSKRMAA